MSKTRSDNWNHSFLTTIQYNKILFKWISLKGIISTEDDLTTNENVIWSIQSNHVEQKKSISELYDSYLTTVPNNHTRPNQIP